MNYETPGTLPKFIKRIIEDEASPEAAIGRITSALPYWSVKALREGALADRGVYQDREYQNKLEQLIQHTEGAYNG